jgi:hypothetical protein
MKKQQLVKIQTYGKHTFEQIQTYGEHTFEPMSIICAIPPYSNTLAQKIYLCALNKLGANYKTSLSSPLLFPLDNNCKTKIIVFTKEIGETKSTRIKEAINQLAGTNLIWSSKEKKDYQTYSPFPTIKYQQYSGTIEIYINQQLLNAYENFVEKGYTKYKLSDILGLQKLHSRRLFEILNAHVNLNNGIYIADIEYFKDIMGCNGVYENNNMFITRAIKNSLGEWSENNIPLSADYILHCKEGGKRITHIEFHIKKVNVEASPTQDKTSEIDKAIKTFNELSSTQKNQLIISLLYGQYHFKSTQQDAILSNPHLLGLFYEIHSKIEASIITPINRTAYMAKCLNFTSAENGIKRNT